MATMGDLIKLLGSRSWRSDLSEIPFVRRVWLDQIPRCFNGLLYFTDRAFLDLKEKLTTALILCQNL
ncbi:hypothetical protein F0562_024837 [Nyssa sinensis]|uniref:Uncharacterized protein n=1 Tax=Nyssa sinensis TaxID=561372 RepID=A0A5J5BCW7_9ASTE|nr:hypothetical protein F0562_024837 [Nyssa sinensis]